ncbi:unnamed protein product, partial [Choristocarpus tenellus]
GSLFFALPDGGAILYNLEGVATAPEAASVMTLDTPAKTAMSFTVPIENWLRRTQRFVVFTMKVTLEEGTHLSTQLTGAKTVEVPPMATRDFALRFLAYKESTTSARVTFTNDQTGEYLFHELILEATAPATQASRTLKNFTSSVTRHLITVANPLPPTAAITFPNDGTDGKGWWSCGSPHVNLTRVGEMSGNLEGVFALEYRPLLPTEPGPEETEIRINIEELGMYRYTLRLTAKVSATRSSLRFESALGATQAEAFTMRVFNAVEEAQFDCRTESGQSTHFRVPDKVKAEACGNWEGQDVRVEVIFEPERPGDVEDTLVISSPLHGEYRCSLRGLCCPPLPQVCGTA